MLDERPATPAQAAAPGNDGQGNPPVATPPSATPATVSISAEEYARLQRDHARVMSFEKRKEFRRSSTPNPGANQEGEPEEVLKAKQELANTQSELHRERVTNRVRDILAKPDYAALPESTKKLIMKNPAILSEADSLEEALLDIEDFIREESAAAKPASGAAAAKPNQPQGHETPPKIGSGGPDAPAAAGLEDVTGLHGVARSRATLRNALKKAKGVKG